MSTDYLKLQSCLTVKGRVLAYCLQAVKVVAPAVGGAPKGSHTINDPKATDVLPASNVAGATVTNAPPPSMLNVVLLQLEAAETPVT